MKDLPCKIASNTQCLPDQRWGVNFYSASPTGSNATVDRRPGNEGVADEGNVVETGLHRESSQRQKFCQIFFLKIPMCPLSRTDVIIAAVAADQSIAGVGVAQRFRLRP
jgi:hypothetical protein